MEEKFICQFCSKQFTTGHGLTYHQNRCKENPNSSQNLKLQTWIYEKHTCKRCSKVMTEYFGSGEFCSMACAQARYHSEENRKKISEGVHKYFINTKKIKYTVKQCLDCNITLGKDNKSGYCRQCYYKHRNELMTNDTRQKLSLAGKKTAENSQRRSKNEIAFCGLCEDFFNNVRHNEPIFNGWDADIIIEDLNLAILWNGPFHYKEIFNGKQSLKQIQNRDKIKIKEIINCGYTPYIIKDLGKASINKINSEFEKLLNYIQLYY